MEMHMCQGNLPWTRSALVTLTARATTTIKERNIILKSDGDFIMKELLANFRAARF